MFKSFSPNPIQTFEKVGKLRFYRELKRDGCQVEAYPTSIPVPSKLTLRENRAPITARRPKLDWPNA